MSPGSFLGLACLVVACSSSSTPSSGAGGAAGQGAGGGATGGSAGSAATGGGGASGGTAGQGSGGTSNGGAGPACTSDSGCAASEFCRFVPTDCNDGGTPRIVVLGPGSCRSRTAPCQKDYDCPHGSVCSSGTCKPFPDSCNIAPPTCPTGCQWDTGPCACVCPSCP